jgi:hypothetical protein
MDWDPDSTSEQKAAIEEQLNGILKAIKAGVTPSDEEQELLFMYIPTTELLGTSDDEDLEALRRFIGLDNHAKTNTS